MGVMSSCHKQELNCNQELQKIEKEYDKKLLNARDDEEKQIDLLGEKLLKLDELECVWCDINELNVIDYFSDLSI